jgi:hypothetical protein
MLEFRPVIRTGPKTTERVQVAKKTIFVSDLSGREISNPRDAVTITVRFGDARRGQYQVDAHPDDPEVKTLIETGTQQARRGRKPKSD